MKILFLPENYFPNVSGVPVVVRYLAEGLHSKGHEVAVATQSFKEEPLQDEIEGVKVYRFKMHKDWKHAYVGDTQGFVDFVIGYRADVNILECTQCITTDVLLPHLDKLTGKKLFHVHGISGLVKGTKPFALKTDLKHTIGHTLNWLSSKIYFGLTLKKAMPLFDATMCLSEVDYGIDYLRKYGQKNYILDNAADNLFFDEEFCSRDVLQKYAPLQNERFMMSCANYTFIKNQMDIIEQYYLSEVSKKMSLVCIGSQTNDYYQNCVQLVNQLEKTIGHRDVHLLVGVQRKDIPAFINKATIYLVGSRWEQYSISIIEAMSQGVPFISTNVGNARILPGGITIENINEMHQAIDKITADKEAYLRLSEAGKKYAYDHCRISVAVDKLESIIYESFE